MIFFSICQQSAKPKEKVWYEMKTYRISEH